MNMQSRSIDVKLGLLLAPMALAWSGVLVAQDSSGEELAARAANAFASSDWSTAANAYEALVERDIDRPVSLFRLARSYQQLESIERAAQLFEQARAAGFQPTARIDYHLARIHASTGDTATALKFLKSMAETAGPIAAAVRQTPEFTTMSETSEFKAIVEQLMPCRSAEHRQFDFWVGQWKVSAAGQPYRGATNSIESIQNGCAVLESYQAGNFAGTSINFYDAQRNVWHQSWMSNTGNVVYLEGGLNDKGEMVLTDRELDISKTTGTINTVTWTPLDGGKVRQHWQASTDGGETWQTAFDGLYEPLEKPD